MKSSYTIIDRKKRISTSCFKNEINILSTVIRISLSVPNLKIKVIFTDCVQNRGVFSSQKHHPRPCVHVKKKLEGYGILVYF